MILKPLAGARSLFCVGGKCCGLFLAYVHQTRFGNAFFEKIRMAGFCTEQDPAIKYFPKEIFQIRARTWVASKRTVALLRRYPQSWSER
ncbi:hypothetical protein, partial [Evtepia sp.]